MMTEFRNSASTLYSPQQKPPCVATVALFAAFIAGTGGFYSPVNATLVAEWTNFPAIAISHTASSVRRKVLQADSIPKAILGIRDGLGLKMSELADILGVSRQAVYLWIKGENVKNEYVRRIWQLSAIAEQVQFAGIDRPEHFIHRPLSPAGGSLLQLLIKGENLDSALATLKEHSRAEQSSRAKRFTQFPTMRGRKHDLSLVLELATPILEEVDD